MELEADASVDERRRYVEDVAMRAVRETVGVGVGGHSGEGGRGGEGVGGERGGGGEGGVAEGQGKAGRRRGKRSLAQREE